jgi:hypothetical protein
MTVFFYVVLCLLTGLGAFFIIGTIKHLKPFADTTKAWYFLFPDWFLEKMGRKAMYYYNILVGIAFILFALFLFYYVHRI